MVREDVAQGIMLLAIFGFIQYNEVKNFWRENSMNILFFSRLIPEEMQEQVKQNAPSGMYASGDRLQKKIIAGLEAHADCNVILHNVLPVDSYPHNYRERYIPAQRFTHRDGQPIPDYNIGYDNMRIKKQFTLPRDIRKSCKRVLKEQTMDAAVFYSADLSFTKVYRDCRKKGLKTIVVIPDLPEFNNVGRLSLPHRIYQKVADKLFRHRLKQVDAIVPLTRQTAEYLGWNKHFAVVEGIANGADAGAVAPITEYGEYLLYTGITHECYGLRDAVRAFLEADLPNVKFVICGTGDSDAWLTELAAKHKNLVFLGVVEHARAHALQMNAAALINPRKNIGEFTKYSFPSKTMEYLAAGKPVIAYLLDGMPKEYAPYILEPKDNSQEALSRCMEEVFSMSVASRQALGAKGQRFVLQEKNEVMQSKKILDLLATLLCK